MQTTYVPRCPTYLSLPWPFQPLTSLRPIQVPHPLAPGVRPLGGREGLFQALASFLHRLPRGVRTLSQGQAGAPGLRTAPLTAVPLPARDTVRDQVDQDKEGLQEASYSKKKLEPKNLGTPKESKPTVGLPEGKARQSCAAVPEREKQVKLEGPMTLRGHGLTTCPGAWGRQLLPGDPGVVFLKTHHEHKEQLEEADQKSWFEGLPKRVHLPGPRVMCRSSTLRCVKRCCTRFCSASLELPMCHPYRV